jgi:dihydrofolate synthase/folylpolyglutamate synthase
MTTIAGAYQQQNAAVAQAALEQLRGTRFAVTSSQVKKSFRRAVWPGRFERIGAIVLDGAHNVAGCRALAAALKEQRMAPVSLLFGVLKGKDAAGMVRALEPVVKECFVVPVKSERATDPRRIASLRGWKGKAVALSSVEHGVARIRAAAKTGPAVAAGSLYLVGAVRSLLTKERS